MYMYVNCINTSEFGSGSKYKQVDITTLTNPSLYNIHLYQITIVCLNYVHFNSHLDVRLLGTFLILSVEILRCALSPINKIVRNQ